MGNLGLRLNSSKDVKVHGELWLQEVQDSVGSWKPLDGWSEQYEPPQKKKETKRKKARRDKLKRRLKELALNKLRSGVTAKFIKVILEASSQLLSNAERNLEESVSSIVILTKLLNIFNAVVLSFRFDTNKKTKHKFYYLRRQASDQLTDVLIPALASAESDMERVDAAAAITKDLTLVLQSQNEFVRSLLESKVDEIMFNASAKMDRGFGQLEAGLEQKAMAESKMQDLLKKSRNTNERKGGADIDEKGKEIQEVTSFQEFMKKSFSNDKATDRKVHEETADWSKTSPQEVEIPLETVAVSLKDARVSLKAAKDDLIEKFTGQVKELIISQMEDLPQHLLSGMMEVIGVVDEWERLYKNVKEESARAESEEELKEKVMTKIEQLHSDMVSSVSAEVDKAVAVIGDLMERGGDDDGNDDDSSQ